MVIHAGEGIMGICTNCGNQIYDESAAICPTCGAAVPGNEPAMDPYATVPVESSAQSYGYQSLHGFNGPNAASYKKAAALTLVGMILLIMAMVLPWYTWTYELENTDDDVSAKFILDEKLFGYKMRMIENDGGDEDTASDSGGWSGEDDEVSSLYRNLSYIMIIAMILGILGFVMIVGSGASTQFKLSYTQSGCYLSVFSAFLAFLCVIMLMLALPLAHDGEMRAEMEESDDDLFSNGPWDSFWGSSSWNYMGRDDLPITSSWHPSFGWFIAIGAGVLNMIGGAIIYKTGKSDVITAHQHSGPRPAQADPAVMTGTQPYEHSQTGAMDQTQFAPGGSYDPVPRTLTQPDTPPFMEVSKPQHDGGTMDETNMGHEGEKRQKTGDDTDVGHEGEKGQQTKDDIEAG